MRTGNFTVVKYGSAGGFPDLAASKKITGGRNFFAGGPSNPNSGATQIVNVAGKAAGSTRQADRDTQRLPRGASAASATRSPSPRRSSVRRGRSSGSIKIGPVTPAQRKIQTTLIAKSATAKVPAKTRSIRSP